MFEANTIAQHHRAQRHRVEDGHHVHRRAQQQCGHPVPRGPHAQGVAGQVVPPEHDGQSRW